MNVDDNPFLDPQPQLKNVFYVSEQISTDNAHIYHKHEHTLEILYIAKGIGRYLIGDREYPIKPGSLLICNANIMHGESPFQRQAIATYCLAFTSVQKAGLPVNMLINPDEPPVIDLSPKDNAVILQLMLALFDFTHRSKPPTLLIKSFAMSALYLVEHIFRVHGASINAAERKKDQLIRQITDYLNTHFAEPLTLARISKDNFISETYLSHLFKTKTGIAPMQYVIYRRLGEAQSLLSETNMPVHEIEEKLGFASSSYFTTIFKRYVGVSPRTYRKYFKK